MISDKLSSVCRRICRNTPDPGKVAVIQNLEVPKSKKDLKNLLDLFSYYRCYVPTFSDIALSLIKLTKKRAPKSSGPNILKRPSTISNRRSADWRFIIRREDAVNICRCFIIRNRRLIIRKRSKRVRTLHRFYTEKES